MAIENGWYPDPVEGNRLRYWSQGAWTEHTRDREPGAEQGSPGTVEAETAAAPALAAPPLPPAPPAPLGPPPGFGAAPSTYGPPQPPAPRRNGAAIAAVIVGIVVVGGLIATIVALLARSGSDANQTADAEVTPTTPAQPTAPAEIKADDVERPLTVPAGFAMPTGFEEHGDDELGVTYGIPEGWVDLTADYAEYYEVGTEDDSEGEVVEYLSAWGSTGTAEFGPDDIVLRHSAFRDNMRPTIFSGSVLYGLTLWYEGIEWEESDEYVSALGLPVVKTVGVPEDQTYALEERVWVVGGGSSAVVVTCTVYSYGHACDTVDEIVDTMWIEP